MPVAREVISDPQPVHVLVSLAETLNPTLAPIRSSER